MVPKSLSFAGLMVPARRHVFFLLAVLAMMPIAPARDWKVSDATIKAAGRFLNLNLQRRKPAGIIKVDRDHQADVYPVSFQVPGKHPAFLILTTQAGRPGRLTIHLHPTEMPRDLAAAIPEEDWFNPERLFDFRAVVEVSAGPPQQHVLSLNQDFFEAVTRSKRPYDLAGLAIDQLAFHLAVPIEEGQKLDLLRVTGLEFTKAAMNAHLRQLLDEIFGRLNALPADSPVREYWTPAVGQAENAIRDLADDPKGETKWRSVLDSVEQLRFKSRTWTIPLGSSQKSRIGTATSLTRISWRHEQLAPSLELPAKIRLEGARNEFESFQVVVTVPGEGLEAISLAASDFKSGDGSATIGSAQVSFFEEIEQFIQPSPGTAQSQVGWLPDALLPVTRPVAVESGTSKPFWITVKVPETIPAGLYTGAVSVRSSGVLLQSIPVELTVHDFALPVTGQFRTQGHFDLQGLADWYSGQDQDRIRKAFYALLMEHRFSPTSEYSARLSPEREDIPWLLKAGANVLLIGGFSSGPLDPGIIDPAYQWLVQKGWIDRAIIYIGDETDDFKAVQGKAREIRRRWPKLRIMVGGSKPREELIGYVDVWDPITFGGQTYNFDPESVKRAIQRGEEVFWYTCVGPRAPFANIYNDHPLTAIRALWWQAWKYGVTGFEYWWFNYWRPNQALSRETPPWPISRRDDWNSRAYDWANGDGLLVYPGPDGMPLPSLRLGVVRDAIEDWEALFLLERAAEMAAAGTGVDRAGMVAEAQALLQVPPEITTDLTHWSKDEGIYWDYRHRVYELLGRLRSSLGPVEFDRYVVDWDRQHRSWLESKFEERVKNIPF